MIFPSLDFGVIICDFPSMSCRLDLLRLLFSWMVRSILFMLYWRISYLIRFLMVLHVSGNYILRFPLAGFNSLLFFKSFSVSSESFSALFCVTFPATFIALCVIVSAIFSYHESMTAPSTSSCKASNLFCSSI